MPPWQWCPRGGAWRLSLFEWLPVLPLSSGEGCFLEGHTRDRHPCRWSKQHGHLGLTAQAQVVFAHGTEAALQPPHLPEGQNAVVGFTSGFFYTETLFLWEDGVAQLTTATCWGLASHVSSLPCALPASEHPPDTSCHIGAPYRRISGPRSSRWPRLSPSAARSSPVPLSAPKSRL